MTLKKDQIFKLKGKVQHYAWGGYNFIPQLLGIAEATQEPCAEYWMGVHSSASSIIETTEGDVVLHDAMKQSPVEWLGEKVVTRFGELPYLFKVLDVKDMLSIQVHPSKIEAEKGFAAEEAAGIPLNAVHRNYKDKNHKPEVMVALSEFWLLHGFLQKDKLKKILNDVPAFNSFTTKFKEGDYKSLYKHVMEMQQQDVNLLLTPLVKEALQKKKENRLKKHDPDWWVAKLYENEVVLKDIDKGIFSIYFFNIVKVRQGEAIFQSAGIPHAYLEGQNIELMANSDNVLRGGLTPKHIDVPELLKHTLFEGITPIVMQGEDVSAAERCYPCPVVDFGLSRITLSSTNNFTDVTRSFEIFIVTEGTLTIEGIRGYVVLSLHKGDAAGIAAGQSYVLRGNAVVYRAFVPEL